MTGNSLSPSLLYREFYVRAKALSNHNKKEKPLESVVRGKVHYFIDQYRDQKEVIFFMQKNLEMCNLTHA